MKNLLTLVLAMIMLVSFVGCGESSKNYESKVAGVWQLVDSDEVFYYYFYEDGTGDVYGITESEKTPHHFNGFTWKIENGYLVQESWGLINSTTKFSIEGSELYNSQKKLYAIKVSDDPTVDIDM